MKTAVFVATKQLQIQYADCLPDAEVIWGRENYKCIRFPGTELTAADCTHRKYSPCPKLGDCPYRQAKRKALAADLVITNYSFALHEMNYAGGFSGWPIHIWDEGDLVEGEIMKFVSLTLTRHQLEQCEIDPPKYKTKLEAWLEWAKPTLEKVRRQLSKLETRLEPFLEAEQEPPKELMWELLHYQRLESKLKIFVDLVDESWVAELDDPERWQFKPTFVRRFGYLLTKHAEKIIAMSATMLSAKDWAWNLGLFNSGGGY